MMYYIKLLVKSIFISLGVAGTIHFSILIVDSAIQKDLTQLNLFKILQLDKIINLSIFNNTIIGFISIFAYYFIIAGIYIILIQKKASE